MKPDWEKLGSAYEASSSVLIGDVDCTVEEEVCRKHDVNGYPTIKYFVDGKPESYNGGRDYDTLEKFVKDTLEVKCDVTAPEGCSDKEKAFIDKQASKSKDDIRKQLVRLEGMKGNSMKAPLKEWLLQRINILRQLNEQ
eukprot:NODE_3337_length_986_cov_62.144354_g3191_i0.p1 GENE.NODE_3337_length_986_cov_62.144354_g3191_i0~~NODE_3337_length_986_cov_62.144354_g3191_i0.p1  ORF type:complete len:139 (-),score=31.99 NODE_3337_length_986_cov_62.144354_g3191_i0:358-774(-)